MSPLNDSFKYPHDPKFKKPKVPKRKGLYASAKPEEDPIPIVGFHQATIWDHTRKPVNFPFFQ